MYESHCEFKGKSISLPIFEPLDPSEEASQATKKLLSPDIMLKVHAIPFIVDRDSENKRKNFDMIGRSGLLNSVVDDLCDYFDYDN